MKARSRSYPNPYLLPRPHVPGVAETFTHALTTLVGIGLLVALAGLLLGGCGGEDIESLLVGSGPTSGPSVVAITPQDGATAVPQGTTIVVTFSEPMDMASAGAAIAIAPAVGGIGSWSPDKTTYTVTPSPALAESTSYTVSIDVLATSASGTPLAAGAAATFRVEDTTPPLLVSTSPEHTSVDVSTLTSIKLVFDEAMDPVSTVMAFSIDPSVSGTFDFDSGAEVLNFVPDAPLAPGTTYNVFLDGTATDQAGNGIYAPAAFRFDTAP